MQPSARPCYFASPRIEQPLKCLLPNTFNLKEQHICALPFGSSCVIPMDQHLNPAFNRPFTVFSLNLRQQNIISKSETEHDPQLLRFIVTSLHTLAAASCHRFGVPRGHVNRIRFDLVSITLTNNMLAANNLTVTDIMSQLLDSSYVTPSTHHFILQLSGPDAFPNNL